MKMLLKYIVFIFLLFLLSLIDGCFFKNTFISFWILVCFCIYKKSDRAIIICAFFGLFRDGISHSLPYFSLIYLFISVGCVWCTEAFLGTNSKNKVLISFFALLSYCLACFFINVVAGVGFLSGDVVFLFFSLVFSALLSPVVCFLFKRLKF